jgi:membrane protease YdiL (CAAX protease family)
VSWDSDVTAQVLSALLVLASLVGAVRSVVRGRTLASRVEARADGRVWLYRTFVFRMWPVMVLPPAIAWASTSITAADLGWSWPHGVGGYLFAAYYLLVLVIASFRVRGRMRRGVVFARRQRVAFMAPRTARERWWAAALSLTAGITEEAVYRGALPAAGIHLYHLPHLVAASAALLLFAAGHLYQGWTGLLGSTAAGFIFTVLYVMSGSLLLPIVVHAVQDVIALLLIPAVSTPQPPSEHPIQPPAASTNADHSGDAALTNADQPGTAAPTRTIPRPPSPGGPPTIRTAVPD